MGLRTYLALLAVLAGLLFASTPAQAAGLGNLDRKALAKAKRELWRARDQEHRGCYRLDWKQEPTKLPKEYRVRLHAEYVTWISSQWLIEIHRRPGKSRATVFAEAGLSKFELPSRLVDEWARTAIHLSKVRAADACQDNFSIGFASHMPSRTVDIVGDPDDEASKQPIDERETLLHLDHAQPLTEELGVDDKVEGFAHTWAVRKLEGLVHFHRETVQPLAPEPLLDGWRARLAQIPRGNPSTADYKRKDRDAVEARLIAHQLELHGNISDVRRLRLMGFDAEALRLSLRVTPKEKLASVAGPLLCQPTSEVFSPALGAIESIGEDGRDALLNALDCNPGTEHYSFLPTILREIANLGGHDASTIAKVRSLAAPHSKPEVRLAAATTLWKLARDPKALTVIANMARGSRSSPGHKKMPDAQSKAITALDRVAGYEPALAAKYLPLFVQVLRKIPTDAQSTFGGIERMVSIVNRIGGHKYDKDYRRFLGHSSSSTVVEVIRAIESYDPEGAARLAHVRVKRHNAGTVDGAAYSWNVLPYLQLLMRTDTNQAVHDLRVAQGILAKSYEEDPWKTGSHKAATDYLAAKSDKARAKALLAFTRAYGSLDTKLEQMALARYAAFGVNEASIEAAELAHEQDTARRELP